MPDQMPKSPQLAPLKITCTSSDCTNNLHCFKATRKMKGSGEAGKCRTCGAQLVEWARVHRRDLADATYTFSALRFELIRHHFWHIPLSERAVRYALRKGRNGLRTSAERQIRRLVGPATPYRDGTQTPRETSPKANAIHYAQHATASCCRKCVEEWHGIPARRELTAEEVRYLSELAMLYLQERLPQLPDEGIKSDRKTRSPAAPARLSDGKVKLNGH